MTVIPEEQAIAPLPTPASEEKFNWQNCWYPVTFVQDLAKDRPYRFSLYDEPLVLFRDQQGKLGCLTDRCCHRAAKLSDGQLIEGKIECLYHGWQFNINGKCVHIPQLPESAKIPRNACVRAFPVVEHQGIVWLWRGETQTADENAIPTMDILHKEGIFLVDTVIDLPFDQTYLVENFLDPAHVPISHDRTELQMRREMAQPLEMEILSVSVAGFAGRYRRLNNSQSPWYSVKFMAPHLVIYDLSHPLSAMTGGFMLYAFPLGQNRSRVLIRRYGNFFSRWFRLKPRWLEHLRQNKLVEEDLPYIVEQSAYVENSRKTLKEVYLPLKTSDVFVIEHRQWLDKFGAEIPIYDGYTTSRREGIGPGETMPLDRYSRHIQLCQSCQQAHQNTERLRQIFIGLAIALGAVAVLMEGYGIKLICVSLSLFAVILAALMGKLKTHFERTYTRKN